MLLPADRLARYLRVVVELGMGDGRLVESLVGTDSQTLYVGVEIDAAHCAAARSRISADNVLILNCSLEELVPTLPDGSVDMFIAVLPDPAFIDESRQDSWGQLYSQLYNKLKIGGMFQLVTELTDPLLQPVSDSEYRRWTAWLEQTFVSLGYVKEHAFDGAPAQYSTRCLDQFRGDTERIRMVTVNFAKPQSPAIAQVKPAL